MKTIDTEAIEASLADWFTRCTDPDAWDWYGIHGSQLADLAVRYEVCRQRLTFATSAVSPGLLWDQNMAAAEELAGTGATHWGYGANQIKARRIMAGDLSALHGRKVEAFAANLLGDLEPVTLDRWAIRAAIGRTTASPREFRAITDAYRQLAQAQHIYPAQAQAVVWVTIRGAAG